MGKKILFLMVLLITISGMSIWADGALGYIEEIAIKEYDSEYDIHVRIKWTGLDDKPATPAGDRGEWMEVRHGELGHRGVDRVLSILLTAFSMQKPCYIRYTNTTLITNAYLKYNE